MPRQWLIELLDKAKHLRDGFSCGEESLDSYLKTQARQANESGTGRTWVAVDVSQAPDQTGRRPVLGYYTVAMSSIDISVVPENQRRGLPGQVPAVLLARLAVDETTQGEGLGALLLVDAFHRIAVASEVVSAHAVVVDALTAEARQFYERYGFLELTDNPLHLFLPMPLVHEIARQARSASP